MKITVEIAKRIAENIDKDELKKFSTKDVAGASSRFDIDSVEIDCEDGYSFERKVNEEFEEFVREACVEDEENAINYIYSVIEEIYPEEIESIDLNWDEINLIVKEIKFKDREGKIYNYEDFGDLVFELGENGLNLDENEIWEIWDENERESKYYRQHRWNYGVE